LVPSLQPVQPRPCCRCNPDAVSILTKPGRPPSPRHQPEEEGPCPQRPSVRISCGSNLLNRPLDCPAAASSCSPSCSPCCAG
jgi:hypothetical protein